MLNLVNPKEWQVERANAGTNFQKAFVRKWLIHQVSAVLAPKTESVSETDSV